MPRVRQEHSHTGFAINGDRVETVVKGNQGTSASGSPGSLSAKSRLSRNSSFHPFQKTWCPWLSDGLSDKRADKVLKEQLSINRR